MRTFPTQRPFGNGTRSPRIVAWAVLSVCTCIAHADPQPAEPSQKAQRITENILFVMFDGLRWQEVFSGAEESLLNKERGGVENVDSIRERFWRNTPEERRAALLPFLWGTIAREGQIYGNQPKQSEATVTNRMHFSYPGYSEVLCGFPDILIVSNAKVPNRNVSVLEWLHRKPEFTGRIAAFTSWDTFPWILNAPRSSILVNSGFAPLEGLDPRLETEEIHVLNQLMGEIALEGDTTRHDALTFRMAIAYLKSAKPRVLFLSFDETDAQGHAGRYDRVLASAHKADGFLRELWETAQSMPEYRGRTSLILTTDHGRGDPPVEWKSHSAAIPGSDRIWAAFLGPDTPALGERTDTDPISQSQIAATLAGLLGYDYRADVPNAGPAIPDVLPAP